MPYFSIRVYEEIIYINDTRYRVKCSTISMQSLYTSILTEIKVPITNVVITKLIAKFAVYVSYVHICSKFAQNANKTIESFSNKG